LTITASSIATNFVRLSGDEPRQLRGSHLPLTTGGYHAPTAYHHTWIEPGLRREDTRNHTRER